MTSLPSPEPDVAASFGLCWQQMAESGHPDTWTRSVPGAIALVSGVPVAGLNGVWVHGADADPEDLAGLAADVAARGVPFGIQGRAVHRERLGALATALGLTPEHDVPLMVLEQDAFLAESATLPGLAIRELSIDEYDLHAAVAAAGFEAPVEVFRRLTAIMRGVVDVRVYIASVEDANVSTAVGVRSSDGAVGVFNVATPPEHRRHGYGAAVTARVATDALTDGARRLWLQSSEPGLAVYERLGFRTVEAWPWWVTT